MAPAPTTPIFGGFSGGSNTIGMDYLLTATWRNKTHIDKVPGYEISRIGVISGDGVAHVAVKYLINGNKRFNNFQLGIFVKLSLV